MTFPPFTDLEALASTLKKNGRHSTLKKVLMQAWRTESCLGDLRQSQDCCNIIRKNLERPKAEYTLEHHTIERSLLTTAILLYARATDTGGKGEERGAIQLQQGQLTKDQWQDHQALISIRNQSLAHVNPTHVVDERFWHRIILFAIRTASGIWRPACATNETGFHLETFQRLERMLPIASEIILPKFQKRMKAVSDQLNESNLDERTFFENQFNPVKVFGSEAAVQRLLAGSVNATDAFWVND
ncbi:MAG TPA: hypothetical protein VJM09_03900 [Sphingobium sp.]|nr:hypothetical protein [Sphingobium sp.]